MKKSELLNKISDILSDIEELTYSHRRFGEELKDILKKVEELPQEEDEIENSEKEAEE